MQLSYENRNAQTPASPPNTLRLEYIYIFATIYPQVQHGAARRVLLRDGGYRSSAATFCRADTACVAQCGKRRCPSL
jgi:hypothetical protein